MGHALGAAFELSSMASLEKWRTLAGTASKERQAATHGLATALQLAVKPCRLTGRGKKKTWDRSVWK